MNTFRFSPIKNKQELLKAIHHIHTQSYILCQKAFDKNLDNAGNMGIFCHFDDEHIHLTKLRKKLTHPSDNPNQKYFKLIEPIVIPAHDNIPSATYTHLYIRKPAQDSPQVGDVDFYMTPDEYEKVKKEIQDGVKYPNARIYDRSDLDMIELIDPKIDVLAYVSTPEETEAVRVKQSELTNL